MTGDIGEGLSDIATGALAARALESDHGHKPDGHTHETACLNCGTSLAGSHCHACGQRAHVHRSLRGFFHDLLHGVLHFEGKTWRTLPLLVWKPGRLTREYIDGRRASYVSPIALFLFVVFLTYAVFSALGGAEAIEPDLTAEARSAYRANEETLAGLRRQRAALTDGSSEATALDRRIEELEDDQQALDMVVGNVGTEFERDFAAGFERNPLPEGNRLSTAIDKVRANPQLAIYKAQTNAYKYSWMLIPLSVPFVWLLFPFSRRFKGYDHTVFTTYSIAFMLALAGLASLLGYFGYGGAGLLLLCYAPFHMYRQLRGAYDLGRWGALWRMLVLSVCAWIAIGLFAGMMGLLTA